MKRGLRTLALAAGLATAVMSVPAVANDEPAYLALGDSVPFGFSPLVTDRSEPDNFVGYPEALGQTLENDVTNASCPGETSGSLISITAADNGCQLFRSRFPLHVSYQGSQLAYAVVFLQSHSATQLVTITVGANDLFILQRNCAGSTTCVIEGLPALLSALQSNLAAIYTQLRGTGYNGQLVVVTYYALNYADLSQVQVIEALDSVLAGVTKAFAGRVADGFTAFAVAAAPFGGDSCAAGLLIRLTATTCDVHPSPAGRDLLANAVKQVLPAPVEH